MHPSSREKNETARTPKTTRVLARRAPQADYYLASGPVGGVDPGDAAGQAPLDNWCASGGVTPSLPGAANGKPTKKRVAKKAKQVMLCCDSQVGGHGHGCAHRGRNELPATPLRDAAPRGGLWDRPAAAPAAAATPATPASVPSEAPAAAVALSASSSDAPGARALDLRCRSPRMCASLAIPLCSHRHITPVRPPENEPPPCIAQRSASWCS